MSDFIKWLETVDSIKKKGEPVKPKQGVTIPSYGDPNAAVSPTTSSINLKDYSGYIGNVKLTGEDDLSYLDNLRAQNQSGIEQSINSIGKFGIYAGTTFVDGIAGTITGAGNLIAGLGDGREASEHFSDFWNNPLSNAMTDIQEWSEKAMPNYKTAAELDAPFWKSALGLEDGFVNFWGDTVFKNLGFTVGAIGAAFLTGGGSAELLGAKTLAKNSLGKLAKTLGKSEDDIARLLMSGEMKASQLTGALAKDASTLKALGGAQQVHGAMLSAMAEARFEAINGSKDYYDKRLNELVQSGIDPDEAEKTASKESLGVGNAIFGLNTALLSVSNIMEFKSIFNPGYNAQAKALKGIVKKEGKYGLESLSRLEKAASVLKNPFTEGTEEMAQLVIEEGSKSYYDRINDPEATNLINAFAGSAMDGMRRAFSEEGFESFFTGFFTGAVGMPNVSEAMRSGDAKKALSAWSGGIAEQVRMLRDEEARGNKHVEKLNAILESKDFKNAYSNVAAALVSEKTKQAALAANDEVAWDVANNQQFHSTVQSFIDAGKLDDFHQTMSEQYQKDGETLRKEWMITNEDGTSTDSFKSMTNAQIKEYNQKNVDAQREIATKIAEFTDQVETKTRGQISEPFKKSLVEALTTIHFTENKGNNLRKNILEKLTAWKANNGIDTPTTLNLRSDSGLEAIKASKGSKIAEPKTEVERIYNDLKDYIKDTNDVDINKQFIEWSKYQKKRQETVDMYQQMMAEPEKYEKKKIEEYQAKIQKALEESQNQTEGSTSDYKTTADFVEAVAKNKYRVKNGVIDEEVPLEFFDEGGKSLGKGVIAKNEKGENVINFQDAPTSKLSAITSHKGSIRIMPLAEKIALRRKTRQKNKSVILKRMQESSKIHSESIQRGIVFEETKLQELTKRKAELTGLLEMAMNEVSSEDLNKLINDTQAELDSVEEKIALLNSNLSSLKDRKLLIEAYQKTVEEEVKENELDQSYNLDKKIKSLEEKLEGDSDRFRLTDLQNESKTGIIKALEIINEEIGFVEKALFEALDYRNSLGKLLDEYKAGLEKLKNRDELIKELNKVIPNSVEFTVTAKRLLADYVLGKVSLSKVSDWLGDLGFEDSEWLNLIVNFKRDFKKLGEDVGKFQLEMDRTREAFRQLEALYKSKLKDQDYLKAFNRLEQLELVRKGFEVTAVKSEVEKMLAEEDEAEKYVLAQAEPSSEKIKPSYERDTVSGNTYLHVDYASQGGNMFDVKQTVSIDGKFYTIPSFVNNAWNKHYGDWMSKLRDFSPYRLELVTVNSASEAQKVAIRGMNPSMKGTDSIYVFVVDAKTGVPVQHEGSLLVSTILDSIYNNYDGKRFSTETVQKFFKEIGAKLSYQETSDTSFWFKLNGELTEFKVADYSSKDEAFRAYQEALYAQMDKLYQTEKSKLYKALDTTPQFRDILSISKGFQVRVKEDAQFSASKVFDPEDLKKAKLSIAPIRKGANDKLSSKPLLTFSDGREIALDARNLNDTEIQFIVDLFIHHADKARLEGNKVVKINDVPLFPERFKKGENRAMLSVLTNYVNFGSERDASKKIMRNKEQMFIANGKLVIITNLDLSTGNRMGAFKTYDFSFDEIDSRQDEIKAFLKTRRRNIGKRYLEDPKRKAKEFKIDSNGKVTEVPTKKLYRDYLLEEVLKTDMVPYTESAQFAQRYFGFSWTGTTPAVNVDTQSGKSTRKITKVQPVKPVKQQEVEADQMDPNAFGNMIAGVQAAQKAPPTTESAPTDLNTYFTTGEFYDTKVKNTLSSKEFEAKLVAAGMDPKKVAIMVVDKSKMKELLESEAAPFGKDLTSGIKVVGDPMKLVQPVLIVLDTRKVDKALVTSTVNLSKATFNNKYVVLDLVKDYDKLRQDFLSKLRKKLEANETPKVETVVKAPVETGEEQFQVNPAIFGFPVSQVAVADTRVEDSSDWDSLPTQTIAYEEVVSEEKPMDDMFEKPDAKAAFAERFNRSKKKVESKTPFTSFGSSNDFRKRNPSKTLDELLQAGLVERECI